MFTMKKLKYAVIGLGFFGEKHLEVLADLPNVDICAISTRRKDRLKELSDRFNIKNVYTDYRQLLANPEVEAVSIVSHVDKHKEMAVAALESGKHVFLEKPMAANVEECEAICVAAEKSKGQFMVGHICRFDPRVLQAREAIKSGSIGDIVSMHSRRNLPAAIGAEVLDKISPMLGDGIHDTDLMMWLTSSKITSVFANNVKFRKFKNPDIAWAMYRFESGAIGVVEVVWALPDSTPYSIDAKMEIIGTKGAIYIDCGNTGVEIQTLQDVSRPDTVYWPETFGKRTGALKSELEYFVNSVIDESPIAIISPKESLAAVKAVTAAEKAARLNQNIII